MGLSHTDTIAQEVSLPLSGVDPWQGFAGDESAADLSSSPSKSNHETGIESARAQKLSVGNSLSKARDSEPVPSANPPSAKGGVSTPLSDLYSASEKLATTSALIACTSMLFNNWKIAAVSWLAATALNIFSSAVKCREIAAASATDDEYLRESKSLTASMLVAGALAAGGSIGLLFGAGTQGAGAVFAMSNLAAQLPGILPGFFYKKMEKLKETGSVAEEPEAEQGIGTGKYTQTELNNIFQEACRVYEDQGARTEAIAMMQKARILAERAGLSIPDGFEIINKKIERGEKLS